MSKAQDRLLQMIYHNQLTELESEMIVETRPLRSLGNNSLVNIIKADEQVLKAVLSNFFINSEGKLWRYTSKGSNRVNLKKDNNNLKAKTRVQVSHGRAPELSLRNIIYMLHTKQCIPVGYVVKLKVDDEETSMDSLRFENMYLALSEESTNIFSTSIPSKTPERFTGLAAIRRLPDTFAKTSNFKYKQFAGCYYIMTPENTIDYKSFNKDWRVVLNQKLSVGVWYMPSAIPEAIMVLNCPWVVEIYNTIKALKIPAGYHTNTIVFEAEEKGKERVYTWRPLKDSLLPIYTLNYNPTSIPDDLYYACVTAGMDPYMIFISDYTMYSSDSDVKREYKRNRLNLLGDHVYDLLRLELIDLLKSKNQTIPKWIYPKYEVTYKYITKELDFSGLDIKKVSSDIAYIKSKVKSTKQLQDSLIYYFGKLPTYEVEQTAIDMLTNTPRSTADLSQYTKVLRTDNETK